MGRTPSAKLKRQLFEEAGYRCAVPTCRGTSALQMEHIQPWSEVKEHDFENMIILCATCHARVTSKEISKDAIRAYKRNLAIISGRYSLYEMRLLELFFGQVQAGMKALSPISEVDLLHVSGLGRDGLIKVLFPEDSTVKVNGISNRTCRLVPTEAGLRFIEQYFGGGEIE